MSFNIHSLKVFLFGNTILNWQVFSFQRTAWWMGFYTVSGALVFVFPSQAVLNVFSKYRQQCVQARMDFLVFLVWVFWKFYLLLPWKTNRSHHAFTYQFLISSVRENDQKIFWNLIPSSVAINSLHGATVNLQEVIWKVLLYSYPVLS